MRRIAIAQMASGAHLNANLEQLEIFFIEASKQQASLLVLPENFALMGHDERDKLEIAEIPEKGVIQEKISMLAAQYQIWVVAGTLPIKAPDDRVFASSLVFDEKGQVVARYDKIHLFDVTVSENEKHMESETIAPGHKPVVVDTPVGRIGLSVCYDVRFPELYRELLNQGAELFTVVSAFTAVTGASHWHTLLKARAIENMSYVLAANQFGKHNKRRETYGHSLIISPWGEVIAEKATGVGVISAEIDLVELREKRKAFPCIAHRIL